MPVLDGEQAEAATLLAQQTAALIDVAQALRRERRAAVTDSLTGLLNRRGFDERLREEIGRASRTGRPLTLLLADCDDLKRINDGAGHEAGDRVLEAFASLLREQKRLTDIAGRLGGDEFAVLLPETGGEEATTVAERLLARLSTVGETPITASIGLAMFPEDGTTSSALLRAADRALYAAKHGGKNRLAATGAPTAVGRIAS
jgi:diguanylate cyclase (GGDEF)-like protein